MEYVHTLPARILRASDRKENAMSELDAPQATPRAAARSWELTVTVIILTILPLLLPFPLYRLELLWIAPIDDAAWQQCGFVCPAAQYVESLAYLLILGPSLLVAVAAVLVGTFGLVRARRHPTSLRKRTLLKVSVICGGVWSGIFGCLLVFAISVLAGTTL
jgi:hypothetical protein